MALPTASELLGYLGLDETSADLTTLGAVLVAEAAAQARRCTIPDPYPDDLREALLRRCARNLAARAVPIATFNSFEGGGQSARVPTKDAEIARLEAPFLTLMVG